MGSRHVGGGIPSVSARGRAATASLIFVTATVALLLASAPAFAQKVPRNFDEEYALYNETVRDIIETGKSNQKCWTEEARNDLIRRIDKAISLIRQFAVAEGIKLTAQSIGKFVNPQLGPFAMKPSQFSGKEDLQGWTNFMVGRLTYLRGKILDTPICRPQPAAGASPPMPTGPFVQPGEVKPQCPQPLPVTAQGVKDELDTLFVKVKKTENFVQSTSQVDLETAIQTLEDEIARRAALIK